MSGNHNVQKKAMAWSKKNEPPNWMKLYGLMSNIAHSRLEGVAGNLVVDDNPIGDAFRQYLQSSEETVQSLIIEKNEAIFLCLINALSATDKIGATMFGNKNFPIFPTDPEYVCYFKTSDLEDFDDFLRKHVEIDSKTSLWGSKILKLK